MIMDIPFLLAAVGEGKEHLGSPASVVFNLLVILFLVFLNGFFVASEFALVKVRSTQLDAIDEADKRVALARRLTSHLDAYLSATQLGITLASLALGWMGEPYVASLIRPILTHIGISAPLHLFYTIFRPAIWFLQVSATWIMKSVYRTNPVADTELTHSEEELRVILTENEDPADDAELGNELLINALDFRRRVVRDIMTPRGDVIYLDMQDSFDANVQVAIESGHTRFPLVQGHLDNTIGLIHIKDLMREMKFDRHDLLAIKRELMPVPEFMPLQKLLRQFLAKRSHFAVVFDEYGGAVGIVT